MGLMEPEYETVEEWLPYDTIIQLCIEDGSYPEDLGENIRFHETLAQSRAITTPDGDELIQWFFVRKKKGKKIPWDQVAFSEDKR